MSNRQSGWIAGAPISLPTGDVRSAGKGLWARMLAAFSAWRRRTAAAMLYGELAKLSDVELERRGIARGDLYRLTSEITDR